MSEQAGCGGQLKTKAEMDQRGVRILCMEHLKVIPAWRVMDSRTMAKKKNRPVQETVPEEASRLDSEPSEMRAIAPKRSVEVWMSRLFR